MIELFVTHPTVFPFQEEEPWVVVRNLCETVSHFRAA